MHMICKFILNVLFTDIVLSFLSFDFTMSIKHSSNDKLGFNTDDMDIYTRPKLPI